MKIMNRLIKFRAWDFEKKVMLDKHDESDDALSGVHFGLPPSFETVNKKYAWMQFTGLSDKNGKEIYEGDIVKLDELVCEISFSDGAFQMILDQNQGRGCAIQERLKRFEVIGNIYENPELLKP